MSSKSNKKMSFDPNHAYIFGLEIAVVINTFLSKQEKEPDLIDENNIHWISKNSEEWVKTHFTFWTRVKLRSIFDEMRGLEIISINQVNERKRFYRVEKDKITERMRERAQISNNYNKWISSSSIKDNNNNINTTTTNSTILSNSNTRDEWSAIDLSLFREIGFTQEHLLEVRKKTKTTPASFINSMRNFIHDYQNGALSKQSITNPITSFIRIMIKVGYYNKNADSYQNDPAASNQGEEGSINPIASATQKSVKNEPMENNDGFSELTTMEEIDETTKNRQMDWVKTELTKILGRETFTWLNNHP